MRWIDLHLSHFASEARYPSRCCKFLVLTILQRGRASDRRGLGVRSGWEQRRRGEAASLESLKNKTTE